MKTIAELKLIQLSLLTNNERRRLKRAEKKIEIEFAREYRKNELARISNEQYEKEQYYKQNEKENQKFLDKVYKQQFCRSN